MLLINSGTEAAVFSQVASAEEAEQPHDGIVCCREAEALRGRARCELLGAHRPFQEQKRTKDVCPFLIPCHIRAGGPVQGPDRGQGMGGFVPHQPSGERPGEAAHPLLMGAFPPGGCWTVVARGSWGSCTPALYLSRDSLGHSTCECHPTPSVTARRSPRGPAPCNWLGP